MEKCGGKVEEQQARRKYGTPPKMLGAFSRERRLRHEDDRADYRQTEPQSVGTGIEHLHALLRGEGGRGVAGWGTQKEGKLLLILIN